VRGEMGEGRGSSMEKENVKSKEEEGHLQLFGKRISPSFSFSTEGKTSKTRDTEKKGGRRKQRFVWRREALLFQGTKKGNVSF